MKMKSLRTLLGISMFLLPCTVWAQINSPEPPAADPGVTTPGPVVIAQAPPDAPPQPVFIRKKVAIGGGPENMMYMTTGGPGPGDGMGAWWKNSDIVSKLQLSDEQVRKISQTFLDHK